MKKRRYCLMCNVFKPERCHHCSACNRCVLNMDHHCPWINNCVGLNNHVFFSTEPIVGAKTCTFSKARMNEAAGRLDEMIENPATASRIRPVNMLRKRRPLQCSRFAANKPNQNLKKTEIVAYLIVVTTESRYWLFSQSRS